MLAFLAAHCTIQHYNALKKGPVLLRQQAGRGIVESNSLKISANKSSIKGNPVYEVADG
jgi:hypothetical protein